MTLSFVSFPAFSRSLARDMTSGRWSPPVPGDSELYLIPVVILAKFLPSPCPPTPGPSGIRSLQASLHHLTGWTEGSLPTEQMCPLSHLRLSFFSSKKKTSAQESSRCVLHTCQWKNSLVQKRAASLKRSRVEVPPQRRSFSQQVCSGSAAAGGPLYLYLSQNKPHILSRISK